MEETAVVSRANAWALLHQYTQSPSLLKHAQSVATCLAAWAARHASELALDPAATAALVERYAATGLLHDFDYERYPSPEEHPFVGVRILEQQGWPEDIRTAILGHALYTGVPRYTHLARALFASDELSGLLTACALVKPTRSIHQVDLAGVRKKNERQSLRPRRQPRRHPPTAHPSWASRSTTRSPSASPPCRPTPPHSASPANPTRSRSSLPP